MPIIGFVGGAAGGGGGVSSVPIILVDEKSNGTNGGTFTSGAWQTRDLNTEYADPGSHASISANAFSLNAGEYLITWFAPAYSCGYHQSRLYNVSDASVVNSGQAGYSDTSVGVQVNSVGAARVNLAASKTFRIEHRCGTTKTTNGLGVACSFGGVEVYTVVEILRLGDPV